MKKIILLFGLLLPCLAFSQGENNNGYIGMDYGIGSSGTYNLNNDCGTPSACNLVINGDFEDFLPSLPPIPYINNINYACNWSNANEATPDYFNANYPNDPEPLWTIQTPCNIFGYQEDNITSNVGYAGMYIRFDTIQNYYWTEPIKTQLSSALLPNTDYQLTFDVSLAEGVSSYSARLQAYLSDTFTTFSGQGEISITNPNMLFTDTSYSNITDGWNKIIFNFTTDNTAGQNVLYIGGLTFQDMIDNNPAGETEGCLHIIKNDFNTSYYYIDNVSLIPLNGGSFILPEIICLNESISDLSDYLDNVPFTGTFSGDGISGNIFDSSLAGTGVHTITYTYTNSTGCSVSLFSKIEVLSLNSADCCPDYLIFSDTENSSSITYNTSDYIETNTDYLVNSNSNVSLKASNYIVIKPESQINSGAQFLARIEDCESTQSAKIMNPNLKSKNLFNINDELPDTEILGLKIYPNPSDGLININNTTIIDNITITDMNGRVVKQVVLGVNEGQINVSDLSQGIYILNAISNGKTFTQKIVKK